MGRYLWGKTQVIERPNCLRPHPSGAPCRICGGRLREGFSGVLLGDVQVTYGICETCGSLLLPNPEWLDRAYRTVLDPDPDGGVGLRAEVVARVVQQLVRSKRVPIHARTLDFGSGQGLLLERLLEFQLDAWGYDPHPTPGRSQERVAASVPEGSFRLITCIEVIEHTVDPMGTMALLEKLLVPDGVLLMSTEFFDWRIHGPDWWYLTPQHGQHITIFSRDAFAELVDNSGLDWNSTVACGRQLHVHVLTQPDHRLHPELLSRVGIVVRRLERKVLVERGLRMLTRLVVNPITVLARLRRHIRRFPLTPPR